MLGHLLQRCPNFEPTLGERLVFPWLVAECWPNPANTRHRPNGGLKLAQKLRRRLNINPALDQHLVSAGNVSPVLVSTLWLRKKQVKLINPGRSCSHHQAAGLASPEKQNLLPFWHCFHIFHCALSHYGMSN